MADQLQCVLCQKVLGGRQGAAAHLYKAHGKNYRDEGDIYIAVNGRVAASRPPSAPTITEPELEELVAAGDSQMWNAVKARVQLAVADRPLHILPLVVLEDEDGNRYLAQRIPSVEL